MIPAFINPRAGNADAARGALESVGDFDVRDVPPATLADRMRAAIADGARRILVAGGDGSIGSAAGAIAGTGIELAILPCGTLNHLARDLSLPLNLEEAAQVAKTGRSVAVDAAVVNDRIFLNTSSVGAYVSFVRARERLERRLGYHIGSLVAGVQLLVHMPTFRVTLEVEQVTREYITPLVFIGVGERELRLPTLGSRVADGKTGLHVMVVRRRSGARTVALGLAAAARGVEAVSRTPALDAFLVDSCRIDRRARSVSIDGEIVQMRPPLRYRHVPGHLRVVVR
ncbi:MAG TPA: diacylglycerol kinase family protein [Gemmatimonadaceae bacterium]|jgi:diacylglycerol kinase family enzyme|nr:diacylglycerol kinase family protein [Gemmatimonadaceae bacterium]